MTTVTPEHRTSLTGDYAIDASHSRVGFAARHAMVATVRGHFGTVEGTLHVDGAAPEQSTATLQIETASLTTGNPDRDAHLRSGDFFDVETHPTITFRSTRAAKVDDETYKMWGDLTIRGVSREVELRLEHTGNSVDPWGGQRIGFEGSTTVDRKDWGLVWNVALEAGGILVSNKVKIEIDVSAVKQS